MFLIQRLFLVVYEQLFKLWIVMLYIFKRSISYCTNIFFLNIIGKDFRIEDHCFVLKPSVKNWPRSTVKDDCGFLSFLCISIWFSKSLFLVQLAANKLHRGIIIIYVVLHTQFDIIVFLFWKSKAAHITIIHYHMW